jgi:hypothetical protein
MDEEGILSNDKDDIQFISLIPTSPSMSTFGF